MVPGTNEKRREVLRDAPALYGLKSEVEERAFNNKILKRRVLSRTISLLSMPTDKAVPLFTCIASVCGPLDFELIASMAIHNSIQQKEYPQKWNGASGLCPCSSILIII